jgi:hypothetical protein
MWLGERNFEIHDLQRNTSRCSAVVANYLAQITADRFPLTPVSILPVKQRHLWPHHQLKACYLQQRL